MIVRDYAAGDGPAVRRLLTAAFPTNLEADLVDRLRKDGDAVIELIAIEGSNVVGHVMFSKMQAPFRALALAPVATSPERQGQGIASRLIEAGLDLARQRGWQASFVLGEPAFYARFGYSAALAASFESPYAGPYFMASPLGGPLPAGSGPVVHARAFADLG